MFRHDYHNLHMSFLLPTDYMHQLTWSMSSLQLIHTFIIT
jgi:hypothetical protein